MRVSWPADSFIWGYRQAVRQRTLTPLSVVRLHLPLPVIKSCSFPLQDFLRGNKSLLRPVASAPFGGWRHHLARWEACHWIRGSLLSPYESSSLANSRGNKKFEEKNRESYTSCTTPTFPLWWLAPPPFRPVGKRVTGFSVACGSLLIQFPCHRKRGHYGCLAMGPCLCRKA